MNKKCLLLFLWCLSAAFSALADEGMWLPSLIGRQVDDMKAKGFRLTAEDIYSVNQASLKDAWCFSDAAVRASWCRPRDCC